MQSQILPAARKLGIGLTAYGVLSRGVAKGMSVAQVAIAWVARQGTDIVPLIGARRRDRLAEALGTIDADLTAAIELAVPKDAAAGARYPSAAMADLDSER